MDRNCLKTVYGESVLTQIAKIKMTGSIIGPVGKKKKKKKIQKIKITGSIIGPAMAGPTGPSATALINVIGRHIHTQTRTSTHTLYYAMIRSCDHSFHCGWLLHLNAALGITAP